MKREILFKAKHNGKWIEGFVQIRKKTEDAVMWIENEHGQMTWLHIDIKTICQFTGRLDVNKKKIFEGDIVSYEESPLNLTTVVWNKKSYSFVLTKDSYGKSFTRLSGLGKLKIVGNIHDEPLDK